MQEAVLQRNSVTTASGGKVNGYQTYFNMATLQSPDELQICILLLR